MIHRVGRPLGRTSVIALLLVVLPASLAMASNGVIVWPTFFRTGPGKQFVVLQELARGATVDVLTCADQWCEVQIGRVLGYVNRSNLNQQTAAAKPTGSAAELNACFDSRRAGYGRGEQLRYCPR